MRIHFTTCQLALKPLILSLILIISVTSLVAQPVVNNFSYQGLGLSPIAGKLLDPSSMFDVDATGLSPKKGILIPRMTTAERNIIAPAAIGLYIYNTDINCFQYYNGTTWLNLCGNNSTASGGTNPCSTVSGTASIGPATTGTCTYSTTLILTGSTGNIQWQKSPDGVYFSDIAGAVGATATVTVNEPILYFTAKVSNGSCTVSYSNTVSATATGCDPITCNTVGWTGDEEANSIIKTADGGYAMAGYTTSFGAGGKDMYIVKLTYNGAIEWTRTIGSTGDETAHSIIETNGGGFAVVGGNLLVKLNADGTVAWQKNISGPVLGYIVQEVNGDYVIAGSTSTVGQGLSDIYIIKLDNTASTVIWQKTIGGTNEDFATALIKTAAGGYAISGHTRSFGASGIDMFIVELTINGIVTFATVVGQAPGTADPGFSIVESAGGGYAVAGWTVVTGLGAVYDFFVAQITSGGVVNWTTTIGGADAEFGNCILKDAGGDYIIGGSTASFPSATDMFVIKLKKVDGTLIWANTIGNTSFDIANSIVATGTGCTLAGYTGSFGSGGEDIYLVNLDVAGNSCVTCNSRSVTPTIFDQTHTPPIYPLILSAATSLGVISTGNMVYSSGGTKKNICQ